MNTLSLKHIGILVLSIPLACQIFFSTVLYINVTTAQKTVQDEIAAKIYSVTTQKLLTAMFERMLYIRLEGRQDGASLVAEPKANKNSFDSIANQLRHYQALSPMAANNLTSAVHLFHEFEKQFALVALNLDNPQENARIEQAISTIITKINLVGKEVAGYDRRAGEDNIATLGIVRHFLFAAFLLSSIGGILLAWLVGQLTYAPISHILANASNMAQNRPLRPLRYGPPELIEIDTALLNIDRILSEANARQHNLYQLSPAFLLELAADGKIIKGNNIVSTWFEFADQSVNFFDFFDGAQRLRLESQFEVARDSKRRIVFQLAAEKLFSVPNHTQWTITWNDQSRSYFCVALDITDSTNIEQLRDQISRYLTIELGAPLKTIASLIAQSKQISINQGCDSWNTKQLAAISNNIERLTNLLNQLDHSTDLSNLGQAASHDVCSNKAVINHSTEAVRSLAQAKGVKLITKVEWAMVRGTESELERVLINLISNAIKYTPAGSRIEVLSQLDKPHQSTSTEMVRFTVVDQGSGIPEQSRQEVFAPFKQLANAKAVASPSTGLGLSVCKTIVERAGGKIWVENGKSGGAAFNFLLPADSAGGQKLID